MKRKLLSILLTLCLAFSLLPTAALADEGEGGDAAPAAANGNVAKIGGTEYTTLATAITAVENNGTIELLTDVNNAKGMRVDTGKTFTVDFKGHTYTVSKPGAGSKNTETNAFQLITGQNITFKNGTICLAEDNLTASVIPDTSPVKYSNIRRVIQCYAALTLEDMTIDATNVFGSAFPMSFNNQPVNITGNTSVILKPGTTTAFDADGNWGPYGRCTVTVNTTGTIDGDLELGSGYLDIKNVKANGVHFCTSCGSAETTDQIKRISITGGTFTTDVSAYVAEGYVQNENGAVETLGETNAVAKVGNTYYKTLADAVAAANGGEAVTLLKNVTERVSISKNLVLDLNGKTLTGEDLVNKNKKHERIALTVDAGTVKVENGVIDGRVNAYDSADLTIDADVTVKNSYNASGYDCFGIVVWGDGTFGQEGCKTPKLTVNGKVIMEKGGVAISTNGTDKSCAVVTINNGAVISTTEDGAIYLPSGKLIMNGGTVSGPTGIQICAGKADITSDFKMNNGTVIATGADQRASKGTGDGLIPDGAAISVVNRNYPNGVPSVTIDGGSFSSANSDAVLAYTWSNGAASEWTDAKTYVKINDGYFTSDPSAYVAEGKYVIKSDKTGYTYTVTNSKPTEAPVFVQENTEAKHGDSVSDDIKKQMTTEVLGKTEVNGVADAVNEDALLKNAGIDVKADTVNKVDVEVKVDVQLTGGDLSDTAKDKTLTFTAEPVATITVTKADGSTDTTSGVAVPNSMLNGKAITVKLPLPAGFTPEQIKHISSDRSVEYFLKTEKRGAKTFEIKDDCAVFKITKFSTFELSGTVTYVEPSYYSGSSSYDPTYSVSTPSKTKNGSVTVSPKSASKGDTVTVTVKPDSGYVLETLTVTDKNGNELTLKDKGNGKYTFTMPAGKVEVKATFMEDNSMLNFFYDVPNNAYFYEAVKWAVKNGITTGVGNNLFAPEQPCTRAQIVTFLWRAAGSPEPKGAASGMTDVVSGSYYEKAVAWAIENGITTGTTTSTFSPDATCTRAQAVTFLARALKAKAASAAEFSDVPTDSYFADAVAWAAANGVTEGIGGGLFGSDNDCTRGQIVTFLYRAYNK